METQKGKTNVRRSDRAQTDKRPDGRFEFNLHAVSRTIFKIYRSYYASLGLTGNEAAVILQVDWAGSLNQSQIAAAVGVGKAAAGVLIIDLEERGYLIRQRSIQDARKIKVSLAQSGEELVEKVYELMAVLEPGLLDGISQKELAVATDVLQKLSENLLVLQKRFDAGEFT